MSVSSSDPPKPILLQHLAFLGHRPATQQRKLRPEELRLREIAAIGASYDEIAGLDHFDQVWISRTFEFLDVHNISMSPDFRVTPWNLASGHDILAPQFRGQPADIWILCWIWNPPAPERLNSDPEPNKASSPHHFENAAWYNAARDAGVRIIVTYSNAVDRNGRKLGLHDRKSEVDSRAFLGPDYIEGPAHEFQMARNCRQLDIAMQTVFRRDFSRCLRAAAGGDEAPE